MWYAIVILFLEIGNLVLKLKSQICELNSRKASQSRQAGEQNWQVEYLRFSISTFQEYKCLDKKCKVKKRLLTSVCPEY